MTYSPLAAAERSRDSTARRGSRWRAGSPRSSYDVWGSGPEDVYAVGEDFTILHYNGAAWSSVDYQADFTPTHVWGTASDDVFIVGDDGTILHFDGRSWMKMRSGTDEWLWDVWGVSGTSVFVVGSEGTILYYDGESWRPMKAAGARTLIAVWGTSFDNVYAASFDGNIYYFDGSLWTQMYHDEKATFLGDVGELPNGHHGGRGLGSHRPVREGMIMGPRGFENGRPDS